MAPSPYSKNGFTIIEVSLVLAIAGLIFLMVFIALPTLQRSQRDAQRRDDIVIFLEAVKKYQTNNRGGLPNDWNSFADNYLKDSFKDPDGSDYILDYQLCSGANNGENCGDVINTMDHKLHIYSQATCSGNNAVKNSNPRNIAVVYRLEGSGTYCANT